MIEARSHLIDLGDSTGARAYAALAEEVRERWPISR